MVAVRRVKFVVASIVVFVVFIGLYQLEKRQHTLWNTRLFSYGKLKISWQSHRPVTLATPLPSVTPKQTVIGERTTKNNSQIVVLSALKTKVSNVNAEQEEEELLNNEIDDTLEWVKRMGHEEQVNQRSRNQDAVTELRDSRSFVDKIFPTAKDERDSNEEISAGRVRVSTVNDVHDQSGENNFPLNKSFMKATVKAKEKKMTDISKEIPVKSLSTTLATIAQTTTTTTTTSAAAAATTDQSSFFTIRIKPNTRQQSNNMTETNPNVKTKGPLKGTSLYTPSPLPRVNTCSLPKLDPWDSSIHHLLKDVGFDPNCKSSYPGSLYDVMDNRLVLKDNSSLSGIRLNYFSLETIHRTEDSDNDFDTKSEVSPINVSTNEVYKSRKMLNSDFFRIRYQIEGKNSETYYYARIVPQQDAIKKSQEIRRGSSFSKKSLPLNVLILGFDSTSNANFIRKMPHTMNWLRTHMRSYFFKGYSIVGDATTPALTALLTGNHEYDLPEGRRGFEGSEPIDRWPWISKLYEKHGYVTLYGEDDPTMSTFNLRLEGFLTPPYNHFMRPFWLATESEGLRDEPGICSRDMSLVNYTMEYLLSFFEAYKETPKFAMGFISYLTHAHPNHLSYGDYDVLHLLKKMKSRGYLDDTLLVILGDHGSRNDDVRSTMQGKLEERLPWLSISVPDWLESRYPELAAALAHNENIISSPFDLHTTFRHILTYPEMPDNSKTYRSLFTNMSRDRTCEDAGIDEHWCPCLKFKPIDVNNQDVQQAAVAVVQHINKLLNSTDTLRMSCHMIKLTAVHNAMQYEPNEKVQRFSSTNQDSDREVRYGTRTRDDQHFLVTIETSPMGARFEATVTMADDKSISVNPNISRINLYGSQPNCIAKKYPYFKKYCVCKK